MDSVFFCMDEVSDMRGVNVAGKECGGRKVKGEGG
jgi:hypothetical protein